MKKSIKIALILAVCIVLVVALVAGFVLIPRHGGRISSNTWYGEESYDREQVQALKKESGKPFQILMLTDLQLDVPFKSKKYLKSSIQEMVDQNKPDLIVLAGDNVAGVLMHFHIKTVVSILEDLGVPWAVVFGNHDREFGNNLNYHAELFLNAENCLFEVGPASVDGLGNYVINIEEEGKVVYSLFLMDSHGEIVTETEKYFDTLRGSQVQWYQDNVAAIRAQEGRDVPSMMFSHIPVPEYRLAYNLAESGSDQATLLAGRRNEDESTARDNSGFFDAFRENGGTHLFVGHDHTNNYSVKYRDVVMTFGTKTGDYSGHLENQTGGLLISIGEDVKIQHLNIPQNK